MFEDMHENEVKEALAKADDLKKELIHVILRHVNTEDDVTPFVALTASVASTAVLLAGLEQLNIDSDDLNSRMELRKGIHQMLDLIVNKMLNEHESQNKQEEQAKKDWKH